jgi:glycosyltransferase involved in cell wall biosynthesis
VDKSKSDRDYILITSQNFPAGGAGATYLNLFCRGLRLNGYSVHVMLLKGFAFGEFTYKGPRKNVTEYGVPYTYLGLTERPEKQLHKLADEFISIARLIFFLFSLSAKRKKVTLLVFNSEIQSNILIHSIAGLLRIRLVKFVAEYIDRSQFRGSILRQIKWYGFQLNFRYLTRKSDKLIVFSFFLRDEYIKMGFDDHKIIVQPNLTDFSFWMSDNNDIKYTIGYSGAPYLKDGLLDLFKAISKLKREGLSVNLLVIGDSTFGKSLIPALREQCSSLGINEKVNFTGLVDTSTVKERLSECRLLAITRPSTIQTKAGFPTKLGEYFATTRPILSTNFGDIERYFENGVDLVIAEAGNPASIASKVKWILQNSEATDLISRTGYVRAKELLDYPMAIKRIIEFIN